MVKVTRFNEMQGHKRKSERESERVKQTDRHIDKERKTKRGACRLPCRVVDGDVLAPVGLRPRDLQLPLPVDGERKRLQVDVEVGRVHQLLLGARVDAFRALAVVPQLEGSEDRGEVSRWGRGAEGEIFGGAVGGEGRKKQ